MDNFFSCLNQQIFLLHTDQESDVQLWEMVQKKFKNLNLIKSLPKRKMPKRKGHTSFWGFSSLGFKLVLIDSELNSALGNQTVFTKKLGVALVVLRKAAKLKNVG